MSKAEVEAAKSPPSSLTQDVVIWGFSQSVAGLLEIFAPVKVVLRAPISTAGGSFEGADYVSEHFENIRTDTKLCEVLRDEGWNPLALRRQRHRAR